MQSVWDDRLGRELVGTFCLVFFPAAFLLDLMDLPGIKARGEDVGLPASVPHGSSLDPSPTGPAVSMPAPAQAPGIHAVLLGIGRLSPHGVAAELGCPGNRHPWTGSPSETFFPSLHQLRIFCCIGGTFLWVCRKSFSATVNSHPSSGILLCPSTVRGWNVKEYSKHASDPNGFAAYQLCLQSSVPVPRPSLL